MIGTNAFDRNKNYFLVKLYTHGRLRDVQSNPIHLSITKSRVGKKCLKTSQTEWFTWQPQLLKITTKK